MLWEKNPRVRSLIWHQSRWSKADRTVTLIGRSVNMESLRVSMTTAPKCIPYDVSSCLALFAACICEDGYPQNSLFQYENVTPRAFNQQSSTIRDLNTANLNH